MCLPIFSPYFACNSRCKRYFSAPGIAFTSVPVSRDVTPEIVTVQTDPGETYVHRSVVSPRRYLDGRNVLDWRVRCYVKNITREESCLSYLNDKSDFQTPSSLITDNRLFASLNSHILELSIYAFYEYSNIRILNQYVLVINNYNINWRKFSRSTRLWWRV